jgi:hypothetical protein
MNAGYCATEPGNGIRVNILDCIALFFRNILRHKYAGLTYEYTDTDRRHAQAFAHYLLGSIFEKEQQHEKALDEFRSALNYMPDSEHIRDKINSF